MELTKPAVYADTAYRPDRIPHQPTPQGRPKGTSRLDHHISVRLPWGYTEDLTPHPLMDDTEPANLVRIENMVHARQSLRGNYDEQFDHICIRPASLSKGSRFWNIMYQMGEGVLPISIIVSVLVTLVGYFKFDKGLIYALKTALPFMVVFIIIPLILWLLSYLYFKLFPIKPGKGAAWELNRQTGMVTVYKDENGQRKAYVKPFYEYDAYIINLPTAQGILRYQFALKHRYEDLIVGSFIMGAVDSQQELWAAWYFIQNYMDITHPLPDMGSLERSRHLDPTTIEHDKQTGRPPRYWRDMSHEQWRAACKAMGARIAQLPLGGQPDLMAKYVDYHLARSFATRE